MFLDHILQMIQYQLCHNFSKLLPYIILNKKFIVERDTIIDDVYIYRLENQRTIVFDGSYYKVGTYKLSSRDVPFISTPFVVMFGGNNNNNNFYGVIRNTGDISVYAGASGSGIDHASNMIGSVTYYVDM